MILIFMVIGFLIGILSGFFGIGGGIILTPLFILLGFPTLEVIGTSLMLTIGASFSGAIAHYRAKNVNWSISLMIGVTGILGVFIARFFVHFLTEQKLDEMVIPVLYVLLLSYSAYCLLVAKKQKSDRFFSKQKKAFYLILIGIATGFLSTSLGVGGGFILVPMLICLLKFSPKQAIGTSLASVIIIVLSGFISVAIHTELNYMMGTMLVIGSFAGAIVGTKMLKIFHSLEAKRYLGYLYLCLIASFIAELLHMQIYGLVILILFSIILYIMMFRRTFITWNHINLTKNYIDRFHKHAS